MSLMTTAKWVTANNIILRKIVYDLYNQIGNSAIKCITSKIDI